MSFAAKPNLTNPAAQGKSARAQAAHFHQELLARIDDYKVGLLEELSNESETFVHFARLAVNEAESLAWSTPHGHLFLPALAEEKIQFVRHWANRQSRVGNGLPAVTSSHEVIRRNEPLEIPQDTLATGCESRSSEAASRAFEAACSDTRL